MVLLLLLLLFFYILKFHVEIALSLFCRFVTSPLPARTYDRVTVVDIAIFGNRSVTSCPNNCSSHGACGTGYSSQICSCNAGFSGSDCSISTCSPSCDSSKGRCVDGVCVCSPGYSGVICQNTVCPFDCWNHGSCVAGICQCNPKYSGSDCRYEVVSTTVAGVSTKYTTLDLGMILQGRNFTKPFAQTSTSKAQISKSSLPFRCPNGRNSISLGNCTSASLNPPSALSKWKSSLYDVKPIRPIAFLSSSSASSANKVADRSTSTFWQSGICYPTGYVQYPHVNILSGVCASGSSCRMSTTSGTPSYVSATDMDTGTSVGVSLVSGSAYFEITLPSATSLRAVTFKVSSTSVRLFGVVLGTNAKMYLSNVLTAYSSVNVDLSQNASRSGVVFSVLRLESSSSFSVFELSARSGPCSEFVGLDLGSVQSVSGVSIRHLAGSNTAGLVSSTVYEGSADGSSWVSLAPSLDPLDPQLAGVLDVEIYPLRQLRYVRVRHVLAELASTKVMLWEISVWDSNGPYGSLGAASPNPVSFRDLIGVNGIWGFGRNSYSSSLSVVNGPYRYSKMSSHARNYHNWIWDTTDPDTTPDYDHMVLAGSVDFGSIPGPSDSALNQKWLNWDNEYSTWRSSGLKVEASIQFTPSSFPQSVFNDPFKAGFNYGYAFARHFGRLRGTGDVSSIEVGNEPWISGMGYADANFYRSVLSGMSQGAKSADPTMRVFPAAFGSLNDTLSRVGPQELSYLDGWNVHAYSWIQTPRGRTGIHPEHSMSTINSVNSYLRFRNAVTPELPVYLTEWGWDSAGGGEDCNPPPERAGAPAFPECVTEDAQALYAVRGALVLARKGLSRLTWYFYGNSPVTAAQWDKSQGISARSGLTSSSAVGYQNKQALYALEGFIGAFGNLRFLSVIREDRDAYVYGLGPVNSNVTTHIVAWRPVSADQQGTIRVTIQNSNLWQLSSVNAFPLNLSCLTDTALVQDVSTISMDIDRCLHVFITGLRS